MKPGAGQPREEPPARDVVVDESARGGKRGRITLHVVGGSPELRGVPLIGTGAGGLANTRPGGELGMVSRLEAELSEMRGSKTALGGARFEVKVYVSRRGVLRVRR
jgi:hypothetical protein